MICCEVSGGLGNQFFRYAFARSIQEQRKARGINDELAINYGKIENHGFDGDLSDFNLNKHSDFRCRRLLLERGLWWQKLVYALVTKVVSKYISIGLKYKILGSVGIVISENPDNEVLCYPSDKLRNIFTVGSFENERYFSNIKDFLFEEFTPKHRELPENKELYDIIRSTNSICLAVRRGDFMTDENKKTFYVCDLSYFQKAVDYIKKHVTNPTFVVFSNDIEWVKDNLKIEGSVYYESGNDPVWETFRLMYSCKHFIISNSTLHWWAQYKGCHKGKIVVSPNRWYNAKGWESHLLLDNFIQIETGVKY